MARSRSQQPTEVELLILRALWERSPLTARQIHNELLKTREANYSTTVKMLSVMLDKGLVKRDESATPQVYRPASSQKVTQKKMLRDLIQKVYDGSSSSLVMQALSTRKSTPEELARIRKLLDDLQEDSQ